MMDNFNLSKFNLDNFNLSEFNLDNFNLSKFNLDNFNLSNFGLDNFNLYFLLNFIATFINLSVLFTNLALFIITALFTNFAFNNFNKQDFLPINPF